MIYEIVRDGARRILAAALRAEVEDYIAALIDQRDEAGRRLVVRNGSHHPREVTTAAGAVEVVAPRVNDRCTDSDSNRAAHSCRLYAVSGNSKKRHVVSSSAGVSVPG